MVSTSFLTYVNNYSPLLGKCQGRNKFFRKISTTGHMGFHHTNKMSEIRGKIRRTAIPLSAREPLRVELSSENGTAFVFISLNNSLYGAASNP